MGGAPDPSSRNDSERRVASHRQRSVPIPTWLKDRLRDAPVVATPWGWYRRRALHTAYERRREYYWRVAQDLGIAYDTEVVGEQIRARLRARGYRPPPRKTGEVHTFAVIPQYGWHRHLLPDLRRLGPVTLFDFVALGFDPREFILPTGRGLARRRQMVSLILPALRRAQAERPVDWLFCYAGGHELSPVCISRITEELGVPTVNMSLDDKQGWAGRQFDDSRGGAVDLTPVFDLFVTSARVACEWHLVEGGRPLFLAEGFDADAFFPSPGEPDVDVSFVGAGYGYRSENVAYLRRHGVTVETFGDGWRGSRWTAAAAAVFSRSRVNLGMGGIEYSESLTNVKARDFEVTGTGGGVYVTSFNPDLAEHFAVGEEILCYRNRAEMLELIRYCLAHPTETREIAARARRRCLREHRWIHRYQHILRVLGILAPFVNPDQNGASPGAAQLGAAHSARFD